MLCYDNSQMLIRPIHLMPNHKPLILTSPKQRQGSRFEQQACEYLQTQGLRLVVQNWQKPKVGELDLVMIETGLAWSTLVFIEVRQRKSSNYGDAALSVTASKQRKVIKTAQSFLQQYPEYAHYDCRFDVIAYNTMSKLNSRNEELDHQPEWIQNAFIASAW
ncbi:MULTISPECIES: YraN family protein [Psychrobacter]|uniref:YraN family protein n=1 Tax=Psychrobacter TaxID=497 RepID=UPI00086F33C0|nr:MULTISPECIES: YraN family protein [Psychrobacter]MBA6244227.1 YraN family protein [Psychrobacter sp. Urea-trap-18]MBA6286639.1 YraN family protein [Psychrobacter sp. Urea-trap-16]MBA6317636.1 YraN family protein [Psychrobacter sp. Urea-trap-20]MBA6334256.1 YraN family protein [Psychrobacter sp. Urea-trap-19]OEH67527.1 MAG: YraN family protein [Psychrobacter sp. B29-1]